MPTATEIRQRLESDVVYWARHCAKILDQNLDIIKLEAKPAQLRVQEALDRQRAAGKPGRVLVPKARKEGVSTWASALAVHHTTTIPNYKALVVAQDKSTATELHGMAEMMVSNLPDRVIDGLALKPQIAGAQRGKEMIFGTRSRRERLEGDLGHNSSLLVDTAGEVQAGRGFTYHLIHGSEVGFWEDIRGKLKALGNSVPYTPETVVILESTPNGRNEFYRLCIQARSGESEYELVFIPWWQEPLYRRPFLAAEERGALIEEIGLGDYGDDEPDLVEMMQEAGLDEDEILERLNWRRWKIMQPEVGGDINDFHQEFPSTFEEGFIATSGQVFAGVLINKVNQRIDQTPAPTQGILSPREWQNRTLRGHDIARPVGVIWTPKSEIAGIIGRGGMWDFWEGPHEPGEYPENHPLHGVGSQHVVAVDPASGEELAGPQGAYHAIEVVNHRTLDQAAEYRSRADPDEIALQAYLVAMLFRKAWIAVETTGGYGNSIVLKLRNDWQYPYVYYRADDEAKKQKQSERMGWQTTPKTKPRMEDRAKELLRTGTDGIRSRLIADQMTTYVRDEKGRTGPEPLAFADNLLAWEIAQWVAHELPLRSEGRHSVSMATNRALAARR